MTLDAPDLRGDSVGVQYVLADGTVTTIDGESSAVAGWSPLQLARVADGPTYTNFKKALTASSNMVILVREPSEPWRHRKASVVPESTTTRDLVDVSS